VPEEAPTRQDVTAGLKEAAAEITARREQEGRPDPQLHAVDEQPFEDEGQGHNDIDEPMSIRQAGEELARERRAKDAERERFNAAVLGTEHGESPEYSHTLDESAAALEQERATAKANLEKAERLQAEAQASMQTFHSQNAGAEVQQQLESVRTQYLNALAQAYPEVQTTDAVERLRFEDPERFNALVNDFQRLDSDFRVKQANAITYENARTQQFKQAAQQHDDAFARNHPELYGPNAPNGATEAIRQEAMAFLREQGMSDQDIMANWNGNGPYSAALRSIAAQEMLLHTARMRLAKKGMAAGKRNAPLPRVQRPGAASAPIGAASANVVNAKKNLDRTGSVRDAAKLVAAQRRAAKRGGNPYA
jgi:hypothetical protein